MHIKKINNFQQYMFKIFHSIQAGKIAFFSFFLSFFPFETFWYVSKLTLNLFQRGKIFLILIQMGEK